jgi:D-tyrosyl-tRNA(Tyr) deacylase
MALCDVQEFNHSRFRVPFTKTANGPGITKLLLRFGPLTPRPSPMIALLQRVTSARVEVDGETVGAIGAGLLVLVAVEPDDGEAQAKRMCERLLGYRVFADEAGRMNRSLSDIQGGLLLVPQFTLAADTASGLRPSFTSAASPGHGRKWFEFLVEAARAGHPIVETGRFGAHMQVHLVNDGPASFVLRSSVTAAQSEP